tara:strand:+ start:2292 stop:3869 length:1578 start_codon:yes stop_codon:yes gene_type:complete
MCLSLPPEGPAADYHPDCSDTQLLVFEGKSKVDGESVFKAVQYIRIAGEFQFLCWPVDDDMLQKYNDKGVYSECIAVSLNDIIAQSTLTEEPAAYRGAWGGGKTEEQDVCVIRPAARPDGTITFAIDLSDFRNRGFNGLDTGQKSAKVVEKLKEVMNAMITEYAQRAGDEAASFVETLQNAIKGLTFDDEPPTSLDELLAAIVQCTVAGLSLIVGLYPRKTTGAFILHFDNLKPQMDENDNPKLKVPLLGLVHEDSFEEQSDNNKEELYEHLNAVRSSYWVASLTTHTNMNGIQIYRSDGVVYDNHIEKTINDNGHQQLQRFPTAPRPLKAGVSHSYLLTPSEFSETYGESIYDVPRANAEKRIKDTFLRPAEGRGAEVQTVWPGGEIPEDCTLRATNIALLPVGKTPIASGFLHVHQFDKEYLSWVFNDDAKSVRGRLSQLAEEARYRASTPLPPSEWSPPDLNRKRPLNEYVDPNERLRLIRPRLAAPKASKAAEAPNHEAGGDDDDDGSATYRSDVWRMGGV